MPPQEEQGSLERMRERLYAPGAGPQVPAAAVRVTGAAPAERWAPPAPPPPKKPGLPRVTLFLIGAGVFFAVALIASAALIIFGGRTVSTENIVITVEAPPNAGSGDTVEFLVTVENKNPVPVTNTQLALDFPEGTRSPEDLALALTHYGDTLGDIPAGGKAQRAVRAVLFGAEGQSIDIPVRFEYRTSGATVPFVKEVSHTLLVTTAPLSVSVGALSQVAAGQPFDIAVAVRSNAAAPIQNAALVAIYPPGFTLREAVPQAGAGGLFDLGTMQPGEEKVVRIRGTIAGEDRETRVIRFATGTRSSPTASSLSVTYTTAEKPIVVEKPFLAPTLTINRETGTDVMLAPGMPVSGSLSFVNTLDVPIEDATVVVALSGSALDRGSIQSANGFYRSSDSTVTFSKETLPALARLAPGQTGSGSFAFMVRSASDLRNPTVTVDISVSGRRMSERNVPTTVTSTVTRTLKVGTALSLAATLSRGGAFTSSGPVPPVADRESTYTVRWSLGNTVNSVGGVAVSAVLPSYVRYTGGSFPQGSAVAFNETTRTITWNAGDVPAGTAEKEVQFEIAFTPSASQRGTTPVLVQATTYTGTDRFTGERVAGTLPMLTAEVAASGVGSGQVQ